MIKAGSEIRESFLRFFEGKGHTRVSSSSLIPKDDPTLLFTNAGMVQFKNAFLGLEDRGYSRAASCQKCVRAGGKHNDLENVGFTARHHTFFEMLGNFSFGDYFKREAIAWAWEYLTEVIQLPKERLWVTVFQDDDEAYRIWLEEMRIPADRIVRLGEKSNFWMMGETGPCGPCSEIIYDQGEGTGCGRPDCHIECGCDRYLEIWNLVFTQFDRDEAGILTPLPKPNIDTGMGLERLAAVAQGVKSNYDTDLFAPLLAAISRTTGKPYGKNEEDDVSLRVIADHARSVAFLIGDGILPSNEGRGYVLRRILRRAARHGKLLGLNQPFLHELTPVVIEAMKETYPDLLDKKSYITKVILNEEQRFMETLDAGLKILQEEVSRLKKAGTTTIPGDVVFRLYDTFGFPTDLTADIVRRDNLTIDEDGFQRAMEVQREKARESWKGSGEEAISALYQKLSTQGISTVFVGHEGVCNAQSQITALLQKEELVDSLAEGEEGELIVAETPFYGEIGGQIGDTGTIEGEDFVFEVLDTRRPLDNLISHVGRVIKGRGRKGDSVNLIVAEDKRRATEANHSATHLLQAAMKTVMGNHIKQSGSLVTAERLRFDFTHFSKIEENELEQIENLANAVIRRNLPVVTRVLPLEEAMKTGATAVFDEKYGEKVRVVRMGDFSMELCGGTHIQRTGDIGFIKIIHESAIAAGVRRIEAVTGREAVNHARRVENELKKAAKLLKVSPFDLGERVEKLIKTQKDQEKEIETLKGRLAAKDSADLLSQAREIRGIRVLTAAVNAPDAKTLRDFGDKLRDRLQSGIILIGSKAEGKAMLLCLVTKDLTDRYSAGSIIREIAPVVGGKGGGRPDMAQAGGPEPENLERALKHLEEMI
ncbi:alanine--tRNA ligase [Syntrophus aciditrophicus]|uniref:Alanine--tRNA ligase n=1 Tax=Syntrophus aciditrophicus (strain SB) TaxID=56780 RepID=SYA_SYNAS|nr:alanine--tRNA ligase [Syntrophus aciditrophicus]Q2LPL7.1 RecName: Full=Alanine--tRNA ligase; AltName: Full=Alanyl-tRNA synthetase; Short=AlaRS [Syntrophus aciditrophicus SB]ABC76219.1 alanyl-tRNA synthetase [Syntrophus aciditrophicus SB]